VSCKQQTRREVAFVLQCDLCGVERTVEGAETAAQARSVLMGMNGRRGRRDDARRWSRRPAPERALPPMQGYWVPRGEMVDVCRECGPTWWARVRAQRAALEAQP
jgi:hypothetical protein